MRPRFPSYHRPDIEYPPGLLFDRLRALDLRTGDYAVFGSGPLAIRGLIDRVGDLDVIVRGSNWDRILSLGEVVVRGGVEIVDLGTGLTFGRSWGYGDFDVDDLIDHAEMIDGLPFVRLDAVAEFKALARRPKDLEHLRMMREACLID